MNLGSSVTRLNVVGNHFGTVSKGCRDFPPRPEFTALRATTAKASFTVRSISFGNWFINWFGFCSLKVLQGKQS